MFKLLFYGLLLYFLYKIIFELVVPISKASSQIKHSLREMQAKQEAARQAFEAQQRNAAAQSVPKPQTQSPTPSDYIDFEEVKP